MKTIDNIDKAFVSLLILMIQYFTILSSLQNILYFFDNIPENL